MITEGLQKSTRKDPRLAGPKPKPPPPQKPAINQPQKINIEDKWPEAVCDGLCLPCKCCGNKTMYDYTVTEKFWKEVVPKKYKKWVVCLPCLDKIATEKGRNFGEHLIRVQFTGIKKTIIMEPSTIYDYSDYKRRWVPFPGNNNEEFKSSHLKEGLLRKGGRNAPAKTPKPKIQPPPQASTQKLRYQSRRSK